LGLLLVWWWLRPSADNATAHPRSRPFQLLLGLLLVWWWLRPSADNAPARPRSRPFQLDSAAAPAAAARDRTLRRLYPLPWRWRRRRHTASALTWRWRRLGVR